VAKTTQGRTVTTMKHRTFTPLRFDHAHRTVSIALTDLEKCRYPRGDPCLTIISVLNSGFPTGYASGSHRVIPVSQTLPVSEAARGLKRPQKRVASGRSYWWVELVAGHATSKGKFENEERSPWI
jgi:hypothetical protein